MDEARGGTKPRTRRQGAGICRAVDRRLRDQRGSCEVRVVAGWAVRSAGARDEIVAIGKKDITAAAGFLGDKAFFLGAQPSSLDATAYAFLVNVLWVPVESPLKTHAQQYPQLEAYCRRMKDKYFSK